jgi:hypothetical protein
MPPVALRHERALMQENVDFRWDARRVEENRGFKALLVQEDVRRSYLNEKFVEALAKRHESLDEKTTKLQVVVTSVTLLLGISLFSINVPISMFGMSANNPGSLREILLIILASVPLANLLNSIEQSRIADTIAIWIVNEAKGNAALERALRLQYGLGSRQSLKSTLNQFEQFKSDATKSKKSLVVAMGVFLWFVLALFFTIGIEVIGLISIVLHPTISVPVSMVVVLYWLCAQSANYGVRIVGGTGANARGPEGPAAGVERL